MIPLSATVFLALFNEYTLKLNGLFADRQYKVYDFDRPEEIFTLSGEELMTNGLTLTLPSEEKAMIIMFSAEG